MCKILNSIFGILQLQLTKPYRISALFPLVQEIIGYRLVRLRQILTWVAIFLTAGLLRLIFHWKPEWMIWATHCECPLSEAEIVTLKVVHAHVEY